MMADALNVVQLFDAATADDIAGSLRRAADSIESETAEDQRTVAMIAVQVCEEGDIKVYGWGRTDRFHSLGVLAMAMRDGIE